VLRVAALIVGLLLALRLLWTARPVLLLAFLGVLFALALGAGAEWLGRWGIPRTPAVVGLFFTVLGALVGLGALMAPTLSEQARELRTRLPEAVNRIEGWLEEHRHGVVGVLLGGQPAPRPDTTVAEAPTGGAPTRTPEARPAPAPAPRQALADQLGALGRYVSGLVTSTVAILGGILLVIVVSVYLAVDPKPYVNGMVALFPAEARRRAREVVGTVGVLLRRWLVTQLIAMLIIGVMSTVAFLALGVPAALALGVIAGLLEFVPYVGPIAAAVPAVAMGFLDSPQTALYVALAAFGIQQVENHLLIPLLMKEGVDLPPVVTIVGQSLMALVFGFLGLLVAVPLLVAGMVAVKLLYVEDVLHEDVEMPAEAEAKAEIATG